MIAPITGFSKLDKEEKIAWLGSTYLAKSPKALETLQKYWHADESVQKLHDEFTENTLSNFYFPFGIAPNFLINAKRFAIPMVVEESSVIAAASKSAKYWSARGGFKAKVLSTKKSGQVHFTYQGAEEKLTAFFEFCKPKLLAAVKDIVSSMEKRGGGVLDIVLENKTDKLDHYYQLHCTFETKDAMGANFINSCLEQFAHTFREEAKTYAPFTAKEKDIHIVMSILSNYVPECLVRAEVSCPVEQLADDANSTGQNFAEKFIEAIRIAEVEPARAVTHNKGIMNGVDAVVLATGNDFRAVEAGVHAYAAKNGSYTSLSHASLENGKFTFWIELPIALGTVGGLTNLHPMVRTAFDILQQPNAKELMKIVATVGLAQNFAAIKSLVTTGIQAGHMKMHLLNILNQFHTTEEEKQQLTTYFQSHAITHSAVANALQNLRDAD